MTFILVAPLKIVNWKRSPIFHVKKTRVPGQLVYNDRIHKYERTVYSPEMNVVELEYLSTLSGIVDIPTVVFDGCNEKGLPWNIKFTAENVIMDNCDEDFTFFNFKAGAFPNLKTLYLPHGTNDQTLLSWPIRWDNRYGIYDKKKKKQIERMTIMLKGTWHPPSYFTFDHFTDLDYLYPSEKTVTNCIKYMDTEEYKEKIHKLCQIMLHPKDCINKNSTLKMNSRYISNDNNNPKDRTNKALSKRHGSFELSNMAEDELGEQRNIKKASDHKKFGFSHLGLKKT